MGDHLVLCVDRLITPATLQSMQAPEAPGPSGDGSCHHTGVQSGETSEDNRPEDYELSDEEEPLIQMVECRICQEEDHIKNLETPCTCGGSLKDCIIWTNLHKFPDSTHDMIAMETSSSTSSPRIPKLSSTLAWRLYEQHYPPGFIRKVFAEMIATFLLVFVTCGSAALSTSDEHMVSKLGASMAGGLIVTVMIYAVGHISGAHMNPAVTLAFATVRHFPWKQVPFYAAAQVTGAIVASFTLGELLHPIKNLGTTSPSGSDLQALIMEIVVTFSMMFITSAVATDTKAIGELAGIAVGSSVCIASILAGPISGGSMNPARTLGPAIASVNYKGLWVYEVGPVSGALLGAWSYNLVRRTDDNPVHAISPRSRSLKVLHRLRNHDDEQVANKDFLGTL